MSTFTREQALKNIEDYNARDDTAKGIEYQNLLKEFEQATRNGKSKVSIVFGKYPLLDRDTTYMKIRISVAGFEYDDILSHVFDGVKDVGCTRFHVISV